MTLECLNIKEPYLSFILRGQKTIEGRLNKGRFKALKVGDSLLIGPYKKIYIVQKINIYCSFKDMLHSEGVKNTIPDKENEEEGEKVYYQFYTKKQEKKFGVLAIKIKAM